MPDFYLFVLVLAISVIITAAIMWFFIRINFKKLEDRLQEFMQVEADREEQLRRRERLVVAAAFEGELLANRTKLEAFILIYQEMLRNLKEPGKAPKYKQGGEIIHERPALARTIFDAYAGRLDLLGVDMAGELSKIYGEVETDPAYKTLSADLSSDQALHVVERIVESAKNLIAPIEKTIAALRVIVRDKTRA